MDLLNFEVTEKEAREFARMEKEAGCDIGVGVHWNLNAMKLQVAKNYDEFMKLGRGAIVPAFRQVGDSRVLTHYIRRCPDCDRESAIPINDQDNRNYGVAGNPFEISSLTITGSLTCPDCHWHGCIKDGEYTPAGFRW